MKLVDKQGRPLGISAREKGNLVKQGLGLRISRSAFLLENIIQRLGAFELPVLSLHGWLADDGIKYLLDTTILPCRCPVHGRICRGIDLSGIVLLGLRAPLQDCRYPVLMRVLRGLYKVTHLYTMLAGVFHLMPGLSQTIFDAL